MERFLVTKEQYDYILKYFNGKVFHRKENGKYLIKMYNGTKNRVEDLINTKLTAIEDE